MASRSRTTAVRSSPTYHGVDGDWSPYRTSYSTCHREHPGSSTSVSRKNLPRHSKKCSLPLVTCHFSRVGSLERQGLRASCADSSPRDHPKVDRQGQGDTRAARFHDEGCAATPPEQHVGTAWNTTSVRVGYRRERRKPRRGRKGRFASWPRGAGVTLGDESGLADFVRGGSFSRGAVARASAVA